jgi:hypothetical protein
LSSFVFYFSCIVDFCLSSRRSSPAPSLIPRLASSHFGGEAVCTESHDSERTISEAAVRETVASDEHAVAESPTLGMMVIMVAGSSEEVAGASIAQVAALVPSSSPQPVSPPATLGISSQRLDDDVLQEFDATHRLSELTTEWGVLAAGAASFREKL